MPEVTAVCLAPMLGPWESAIKEATAHSGRGPLIRLILCWKMISPMASFTRTHCLWKKCSKAKDKAPHALCLMWMFGIHDTFGLALKALRTTRMKNRE